MVVRPLSSALQEKAKTELNEVPDRVEEDLKYIKDWITKQPHLTVRTDDQSLVTFLRGCKFSFQRTKEKLDMFYTMRTLVPEFFDNRDPFLPEIQEFLRRSLLVPLPKTVDAGATRVVIIRPGPSDPEKITYITAVKVTIMILDILLNEDDNCVIGGQELLLDMQDLSYKYMLQMTPSILYKLVVCLQYAYPTRPKGFHFINSPPMFESVFNILKQLTTEKIIKRIKFYNKDDLNTLHKVIPLSILPREYGGEEDSIDKIAAEWKLKVESYRDWFTADAAYQSDETKRPGKPKTSADMFGVEGSFRKLNID